MSFGGEKLVDDRLLTVVLYGSHLYGTATDASDIDLKAIFMPTLDELLLKSGRVAAPSLNDILLVNKKAWEGKKVEVEYFTLHEFVRLAVGGQTMPLDMLHAPSANVLHASYVWLALQANRRACISKNMTAFMGYARGQAMKYSSKGDRLEILKAVRVWLGATKAKTLAEAWNDMLSADWAISKHIRFLAGTPDSNNQRIVEICQRQLMEGVAVEYALSVVDGAIAKYGERAKKAATAGGADWKALSHAVRIVSEISCMAQKSKLEFPLPERAWLLACKRGELPIEEVLTRLEERFEQAEKDLAQSGLPEKVDAEWWNRWLLSMVKEFYGLERE